MRTNTGSASNMELDQDAACASSLAKLPAAQKRARTNKQGTFNRHDRIQIASLNMAGLTDANKRKYII